MDEVDINLGLKVFHKMLDISEQSPQNLLIQKCGTNKKTTFFS
jgi:hypothetical protein